MIGRKEDKLAAKNAIDDVLSNITICELMLEEEKAQDSEFGKHVQTFKGIFSRFAKLVEDKDPNKEEKEQGFKEKIQSIKDYTKQLKQSCAPEKNLSPDEIEARWTKYLASLFNFTIYNSETYQLAKSLHNTLAVLHKLSEGAFMKLILAFSPKSASEGINSILLYLPILKTNCETHERVMRYQANQSSNVATTSNLHQAAQNNGHHAPTPSKKFIFK